MPDDERDNVATTEYRSGNLWVREHSIAAPLDHSRPGEPESITVFARELSLASEKSRDLPLLLFLQGGPGGEGPRPLGPGWWSAAVRTHRVVLLDQRGTGRSSPIDGAVIGQIEDPADQAAYLAHFRGDSIIRDAELLREKVYGGRRWQTLGQSYGGFLTLIYLSMFPEALEACHVTGGLPSIEADAAAVYRATYPRQAYMNERFYGLYPRDAELTARIADRLEAEPQVLPCGDLLDVERLQTLGLSFGMSTGIDALHWLLDTAMSHDGTISRRFLAEAEARTGFATNPLYAVLQECIYQQGSGSATQWAAEAERAHYPQFGPGARPLYFTGEMIYPWMFERYSELRPFHAAVEELHVRDTWPALYDPSVLAANDVPVAAIQYYDDPYVDLGLAMTNRTAVGNLEVWVTSEYLHDGLRMAGADILPRLFEMTAGR